MFMMTSQVLKFTDSWKTQKSKYLQNETQFFLLVKKFINCSLRAILWQKIVFLAEVTFNILLKLFFKLTQSNYLNIWNCRVQFARFSFIYWFIYLISLFIYFNLSFFYFFIYLLNYYFKQVDLFDKKGIHLIDRLSQVSKDIASWRGT